MLLVVPPLLWDGFFSPSHRFQLMIHKQFVSQEIYISSYVRWFCQTVPFTFHRKPLVICCVSQNHNRRIYNLLVGQPLRLTAVPDKNEKKTIQTKPELHFSSCSLTLTIRLVQLRTTIQTTKISCNRWRRTVSL